jgi:hypothetical protein
MGPVLCNFHKIKITFAQENAVSSRNADPSLEISHSKIAYRCVGFLINPIPSQRRRIVINNLIPSQGRCIKISQIQLEIQSSETSVSRNRDSCLSWGSSQRKIRVPLCGHPTSLIDISSEFTACCERQGASSNCQMPHHDAPCNQVSFRPSLRPPRMPQQRAV